MKVRFNKPIDLNSERTHRRRDVVQVKYHRVLSSCWESLESFSKNRKDSHMKNLERLEKKLQKDIEVRERELAKAKATHQEARKSTARNRSQRDGGTKRGQQAPAAA